MLNRSLPNFAELEGLLGKPPVLHTEDAEFYRKIRARFMACFRPEDVIQWWLVDRLVDDAWLIKRYSRHQTVAVERWYQQSLQYQTQRVKLQNATKEKRTSFLADRMSQTPPDVAQLRHLEDTMLESLSDVEEILKRTPTELEHSRALEEGITFHEQLDKLIASATKRFNDALVLLEHYNELVGQRVRQAAQELLAPRADRQTKIIVFKPNHLQSSPPIRLHPRKSIRRPIRSPSRIRLLSRSLRLPVGKLIRLCRPSRPSRFPIRLSEQRLARFRRPRTLLLLPHPIRHPVNRGGLGRQFHGGEQVSADHQSSAKKPNACKSGGPRTAAGKKNASRNALRHGLSAVVHRQPAPSATIERLAKAICGESERADMLAPARLIATNALVLRAIAAQRTAVVERLRESTAIALAKGDNSLDLARARSMQTWLARREIDELVPKALKKYNNELKSIKQARDLGLIVPGNIFSLLEWTDSIEHEQHAFETAQKLVEQNERDEFAALEEAASDLIRLERYERRCWSQQKRAIRDFMNLRMIVDMNRVDEI